jgi:hypothetical protein
MRLKVSGAGQQTQGSWRTAAARAGSSRCSCAYAYRDVGALLQQVDIQIVGVQCQGDLRVKRMRKAGSSGTTACSMKDDAAFTRSSPAGCWRRMVICFFGGVHGRRESRACVPERRGLPPSAPAGGWCGASASRPAFSQAGASGAADARHRLRPGWSAAAVMEPLSTTATEGLQLFKRGFHAGSLGPDC